MEFGKTIRLVGGGLVMLLGSACSGVAVEDEGTASNEEVGERASALVGCTSANAVPLLGPNVSNRLGANACVTVIPQMLPSWWQYSDGTLRVQIANFDNNDNAFPFDVEWENTCGTEQGTVSYPQPWQQREMGHPSAQPACGIVMKLGGQMTEDVLIFWGA